MSRDVRPSLQQQMSRTEGLSLDCPSSKESTPLRTPSNEQAQFTMITYAKITMAHTGSCEPTQGLVTWVSFSSAATRNRAVPGPTGVTKV